jgi:hypothetical protein
VTDWEGLALREVKTGDVISTEVTFTAGCITGLVDFTVEVEEGGRGDVGSCRVVYWLDVSSPLTAELVVGGAAVTVELLQASLISIFG